MVKMVMWSRCSKWSRSNGEMVKVKMVKVKMVIWS